METNPLYHIDKKYIFKFLVSSIFGLGAFMLPLPILENKTLVSASSDWLLIKFSDLLFIFIVIITFFSTILGIVAFYRRKKGLDKNGSINFIIDKYFYTQPIYLITRILSSIFLLVIIFNINFSVINSEKTGLNMIELSKSLITISMALSYVLPFLTNCGVMEFFGVLTRNMITPLFKVPGVAALDLVTSWFGASNAEVILCREKYHLGYYSKRDAANIMCNFSLVSVSFVYVVSQVTRLENDFTLIFLVACLISVILAIIMPRIFPLKNIPNEYYDKQIVIDNNPPRGVSTLKWALIKGIERSKEFGLKEIFYDGTQIMISIWIGLIPVVVGWGTLGLIIVYNTSFFTYLSYPIGIIFELLNVPSAFEVAPATLVGFIDMFIPPLLVTDIDSEFTRFIITELSLVQMIYLTEVGTIILQSEIGIDFKKLFLIFIERTILAFPIILFFAHILY